MLSIRIRWKDACKSELQLKTKIAYRTFHKDAMFRIKNSKKKHRKKGKSNEQQRTPLSRRSI